MAKPLIDLRPASFRGVAFEMETGGQSGGRRIAQHIYPYRDEPNPEDMGRKARGFTVTAFVLGGDYQAKRDKLIDALEQKGAGEYVNHWGKTRTVVVESYDMSESLKEGGIARFNITFSEAGAEVTHTTEALTGFDVDLSALDVIQEALDDFKSNFDLDGVNSLVTTVASKVSSLGATLQSYMSGEAFGIGDASSALSSISGIVSTVKSLSGDFGLGELVSRFSFLRGLVGFSSSPDVTSSDIGDQIVSNMQTTMSYATTADAALSASLKLVSYPTNMAMLATSEQDATNQTAIDNLVQRTALALAAQAAAEVEFDSYDTAVAVRAKLSNAIDDAALTSPTAVYTSLMALRRATYADITTRAADLVKLRDFTPQTTRSALIIAYQLYGDASREDEILSRNKIPHPGFVPGGRTLKVANA
jgi:prophage DNA circulation protein